MTNSASLGPWVRRFLLEHLVAERNLAINTQKSYRDMLTLLLPFVAHKTRKPIDRLTVDDVTPRIVRLFLTDMEQQRNCTTSTRNQRLGGIHALTRFIAEHSPEHIDWCSQIRLIPFKKTSQPTITYLEKAEMDALLAAPDCQTTQGRREYGVLLFLYNSGARVSEATQLRIGDVDWLLQCVKIVGKGGKQRRCPLWSSTLEQLRNLAGTRDASESMFLNRCHQTMTRSGIHALVKRCAVKACALAPSLKSKKISPHVIRHYLPFLIMSSNLMNTAQMYLNYRSCHAELDRITRHSFPG